MNQTEINQNNLTIAELMGWSFEYNDFGGPTTKCRATRPDDSVVTSPYFSEWLDLDELAIALPNYTTELGLAYSAAVSLRKNITLHVEEGNKDNHVLVGAVRIGLSLNPDEAEVANAICMAIYFGEGIQS